MKKIAMALALLLAAASCDFLDVVPEGSPTQDDIYKTQAQAEKMLFMVYGKCPDLFHAQAMPDLSGGDDLISSYYGSVRYFSWKSLVYATSQESPTNTYFNMWGTTSGLPTGNYSYNIYEGIRYAYNFLNNIGSVPDISEANLRYWSGEAHFLIAHLHQILLEYYGPIVLAREEIDLNAPASSVNVPRSTYDECVNFIEEEFRKAADMLPDYWGPIAYGRAIKATALAYRARLLLYAASPLVNGNSEFYADFVNKDGTHLINQTYDAEKWKRAMDAAKEAIDCVEASKETGAYTMDDRQLGLSVSKSTSTTDPFELGRANYTYIFTGDGNATQFLNQNEYLMSLNKSGSITYTQKQFGCHLANNYTKVSGAYRGYLCPTFEAVQMYYTRNGLPWEDDPETKDIDPLAYNKAAGTVEMHLHKEPRFYASVGYDRGTYRFNGGKMTIKAHKGEPQGIEGLTESARKHGVKFGIWIEPEMTNTRSELYEKHPDWVIQQPYRENRKGRGGTQQVLDLSNPAVQEFVFGVVDRLMTAHPDIAYIKWDDNMTLYNYGSTFLPADRQSHLYIEYHRGMDKVLRRIREKYPRLVMQSCASGGGRVNYGVLPYYDEFWTSDNTDALQRIYMQWGVSNFYPAVAMASHVSASPNHQTGRNVPLKLRFDVAMSGRLGLELQPSKMTGKEKEFARRAIADYKEIRPIVQQGDLYRLISPYDKTGYASLMYVAPEKDRAVWFVYKLEHFLNMPSPAFRMAGLDPGKRYRITELNVDGKPVPQDGKTFSGAFLMENGLEFTVGKEYASRVLELKAVE